MDPAQPASTGPAFELADDRAFYATLSLYVPNDRLTSFIGEPVSPETFARVQAASATSRNLSDAIDPLFNDIADRERLGRVEDYLIATAHTGEAEWLDIEVPGDISWQTEGVRFTAMPPGLARSRRLRLRRFWYSHRNGAISYHLSFRFDYEHTAGDFYFLSLFQKLIAPKEFALTEEKRGKTVDITRDLTGIGPLDLVRLRQGKDEHRFWSFVRDRFERDFAELAVALPRGRSKRRPARQDAFTSLVATQPVIEVPGLIMPAARACYFFQDEVFFGLLSPPVDVDTGARPTRPMLVHEECYKPYPERIAALVTQARDSGATEVCLDEPYWEWVKQKQIENPRNCLKYLFISGFNQNIIDFMNQDASEVLDSIDPIYPVTDEQADESFFVRYANPRAIITFVRRSRSLEVGNDHIGTCPYAFLIHVTSLHNEFLARANEKRTFDVVDEVASFNTQRNFKRAADALYGFRANVYAEYLRHRYSNIFRYDTEADVFAEIERRRGTSRKDRFLEDLVRNLESETRDLEARISKREENLMNMLLGAVGIFGFFQLLFDWSDKLSALGREGGQGALRLITRPPFLQIDVSEGLTLADKLTVGGLYLSAAFTVIWLIFLIYVIVRMIRR